MGFTSQTELPPNKLRLLKKKYQGFSLLIEWICDTLIKLLNVALEMFPFCCLCVHSVFVYFAGIMLDIAAGYVLA